MERKELDVSVADDNNEYQAKWIEIIQPNCKNIIVGVCYRHPRRKSDDSFCTYIANTLVKVNKKNKLAFVVGDFNYDLLKIENDKFSALFLETMSSHNYQPCILEPTRLAIGNRPSLIDNIFVNSVEKEVYAGNLMAKLSDHLPQFIIMKDVVTKPSKKKRVKKDFSNFSADSYKADLRNINLTNTDSDDVSKLFKELQDGYISVVEKHVPCITLTAKEFSFKQKPWITKDIQNKIREKNSYNAKFSRKKIPFGWSATNYSTKKYVNYFLIQKRNTTRNTLKLIFVT